MPRNVEGTVVVFSWVNCLILYAPFYQDAKTSQIYCTRGFQLSSTVIDSWDSHATFLQDHCKRLSNSLNWLNETVIVKVASYRSGYFMSEILYLYGELDARVRPLVFFIRRWAKAMNIIEEVRPTLKPTNFTITLMVLFFLQQKEMLPAFAVLKANAGKEILGWRPTRTLVCNNNALIHYIP